MNLKNAIFNTSILALSLFSFSSNAETLKVGTEPTFAPFEMQDSVSGEITGFDIDLIKAIAKAEGFDVEILNTPFDALIPGVVTGQIDVIASGVSITEERAKVVSFSTPYYKSGISAVIRGSDKDKYKKLSDFGKAKLCAQIGTTGANFAEELTNNVVRFNTVPEAFMELKNGGCEATLNDRPVNSYFLFKSGKDDFIELSDIGNGEDYGFVVSKKNQELLEKLNRGLLSVKQSGIYDQLYSKWFSSDSASGQ